jgi:Nucleotide modification associated domain 2
MPTLFSYCIPYDDGAAPNPFWGLCTLAICKPRIRRSANAGDWVVGTGSVVSPVGNVSGAVVYAMLVTQKVTMEDYDRLTQSELPRKIPLVDSADLRRRFGDSIYDFSAPPPVSSPKRARRGEPKHRPERGLGPPLQPLLLLRRQAGGSA